MPQAYNKDLARTVGGAFGKQSRFMNATDSGAETKRRLMNKTKIEKRFRERHLAFIEKNTNIAKSNLDRLSRDLRQSLLKTVAYKEVIAKRTFSKIPDRTERLNGKYTAYAMRFEIADQIKKLEPHYVREQKARDEIKKQRGFMDKIIRRNLRTILSPRERERKRLMHELDLHRGDSFASISSDGSKHGAPANNMVSRQNTKGLIVTKDQFKSKGNKSSLTVTLPSIDLNKKPPANKGKGKRKVMTIETDRPVGNGKLVLPPINQPQTVR